MSSSESETRTRILATTVQLMEERPSQTVRMQDIAAAVGISRQAVYLHFGSRAALLIAATRYVDEVRDLDGRLRKWNAAETGIERLDEYIVFWGDHISEVYGIAMALLAVRDTDKAAAAAWQDRMDAVRDGCRITIETLVRDGMLDPMWTCEQATDLFWTMLAIRNWEQLTIECGWSTEQYVSWMQTIARRTFVQKKED